MERIIFSTQGKKAEFTFVDSNDMQAIDPAMFQLPKISFQAIEDNIRTLIGAEVFINFYQVEYQTPQIRKEIKVQQDSWTKEKVASQKEDAFLNWTEEKYKKIGKENVQEFGLNFVADKYTDISITTHVIEKDFTFNSNKVYEIIPAQRKKAGKDNWVQIRIVADNGIKKWPCSIKQGAKYKMPHEIPAVYNNGENFPIKFIGNHHEDLRNKWIENKHLFEAIGGVLNEISVYLGISRKDLFYKVFSEEVSTESLKAGIKRLVKLHKLMFEKYKVKTWIGRFKTMSGHVEMAEVLKMLPLASEIKKQNIIALDPRIGKIVGKLKNEKHVVQMTFQNEDTEYRTMLRLIYRDFQRHILAVAERAFFI